MLNLLAPVRLTDPGQRDGVLRGHSGDYVFEARLARAVVSYGLDPETLYKGYGRVVRLVLYRPVGDTGIQVKVAAFDRGWLYGRKQHLQTIRRIVSYLEKRPF